MNLKTIKATNTPLHFGPIDDIKSYWASHFYAVLQCLHYQITLTHSPRTDLVVLYPNWTLGNLRGTLKPNFFNMIKQSVQNHGFQYFLACFLNLKMSSEVVDEIINQVCNIYEIDLDRGFLSFTFHIAGGDSILSQGLNERFDVVIPDGTSEEILDVIDRSDICLLLRYAGNKNFALFGEVEGNHGSKQLRGSYWGKRPKLSSFSIGVAQGKTKLAWIGTSIFDMIPRAHVIFEKDHFVVHDFRRTVEYFEDIFQNGPTWKRCSGDEEWDFFANMIRVNWDTPMPTLLNIIHSYVDSHDEVKWQHESPLPVVTNIQS
jgi:hypothetical protein